MKNNPKYIIIHCTDCSYKSIPDQFIACNGWHKDRSFPLSSLGYYIGYQRLITGEKNYQCRLDTDEGAHCNQQLNGLSMNFQSLGICMGFDGDIEFPTPVQHDLLKKQVQEWQDQYGIPNENVYFHRHFATEKTCPGNLITDAWLAAILQRDIIPPKENQCIAEKAVIAEQQKQLDWYGKLIEVLKEFIS